MSYRRGDTAGHAGRLHDELVRVFGADRVFMDIGGLAPGDDFIRVLRQRLSESAVVLVAMGPRWMGVKADGTRRIDDPNDFVRLEVVTALADPSTRVIPVLCEGATMPDEASLPAPIMPLARRQAFELSDARWRHDVAALFEAVKPHVPEAGRAKRAVQRAAMAGLLVVLVALGLTSTVRAVMDRFARDVAKPGNQRVTASPDRVDQVPAETRMPAAPPPSVIPPHVVATAATQLARARREWVNDATVAFIEVDCKWGRHGECPLKIRFSSSSRVASLEATQQAPDSAWKYRPGGGVSRNPPLSLEIVELDHILATVRTAGVTSDLERAKLEHVRLQNGSTAPRWTIWPKDRQQAGRDGRLCFEPGSGARVDCRTGQ